MTTTILAPTSSTDETTPRLRRRYLVHQFESLGHKVTIEPAA